MRHRVVSFAGVIIQVLLVMAFVRLSWAQGCTQTAKPEITSDLTEGVKDVSGKIGAITVAAGHTCTARVELWLRLGAAGDGKPTEDELKKTTDDHGNQLRVLLGTAPVASSQFDIKLSDPLVAGKTLFLIEIITDTQGGAATDQNPIFSDGVVRVAALANCLQIPKNAKPEITSNLTEGVKEVSGKVGPLTAATNHTCTARIELWLRLVAAGDAKPGDDKLKETVDIHGNQVRALLGTAAATGGQFDIKLSDPLVSGQTLFLTEIITDTQGSTGTDQNPIFSDGVVRVAAFGSWGLVRAYFTSGFLLSQDQGSFSQSSLFLAFTVDKTWKMPGYYFGRTREKKDKNGKPEKDANGNKIEVTTSRLKWPPGINSFFETRLTAIPVNSCAQTSSGTSGSSTSSACVTTSSTGTTTTLDTFLANRKTARLGVGAYLPFTMMGWTYKGTPNTLFLAPIAKIGFDTPAGSLSQTQPSNGTSGGTTTGTVTALNPTNFYKFYTFGGRFGHYAMTSSRDEAPEALSYLDFTFGRFSNLESLVDNGTQTGSRERLWRISVEGILKVPSTPLIIGFNANVGMNNPNAPRVIQGAGDDLRFLFGAKFDVAKLLAHIGQVAP